MTEEQEAFLKKVIAEADKDMKEYWVASGDRVTIQHEDTYVVSHVILGKELETLFQCPKVWGLFTLVGVKHGSNWYYPIPVMSQGTLDIRELMGVGKTKLQSMVFKKMEEKVRTYTVTEKDGFTYSVKVESNRM